MTALLLSVLLVAGPGVANELPAVLPGWWENTFTLRMASPAGRAAQEVPPRVLKDEECVTPEMARKRGFQDLVDEECRIRERRRSGSKVTFTAECAGDMPGTLKGEIRFTSDRRWEGTEQRTARGGTMTTSVVARWVRPCTKAELADVEEDERLDGAADVESAPDLAEDAFEEEPAKGDRR